MAAVIRRAFDQYLGDDVDAKVALSATFGADRTATPPSRDSWRRG